MYTLNTQLARFKYAPDAAKILVNIKWFRLDGDSQADYFSQMELDAFLNFIECNKANFPGSQFIEEAKAEKPPIPLVGELSKTAMPLYLILSRKEHKNWQDDIYNAMAIVLMDEDYDTIIGYDLDFDIIGKIEIYRQAK